MQRISDLSRTNRTGGLVADQTATRVRPRTCGSSAVGRGHVSPSPGARRSFSIRKGRRLPTQFWRAPGCEGRQDLDQASDEAERPALCRVIPPREEGCGRQNLGPQAPSSGSRKGGYDFDWARGSSPTDDPVHRVFTIPLPSCYPVRGGAVIHERDEEQSHAELAKGAPVVTRFAVGVGRRVQGRHRSACGTVTCIHTFLGVPSSCQPSSSR